jgi:hypothetical protein
MQESLLLKQHCLLNSEVNRGYAEIQKHLPYFDAVDLFYVCVLVSGPIVFGRATSNGKLRAKDFRMLQICMIAYWPCLHKDIQITLTSKNFL